MRRVAAAPLCAAWLGLALCSGCEAKFAQRLVAPDLLENPSIERGRSRPKLEIGPYVIETVERTSRPAQSEFGPASAGSLRLEVRRSDQLLHLHCNSLRSMGADADLAAVAGRPTDRLDFRCEVQAPTGVYALHIEGRMSENLRGKVEGPGGQTVAHLELVLFYSVLSSAIQRPAPTPIAQAYIDDEAVAAMVLSRPERTWFDVNTGPVARDVLLCMMVGVRFVPGLIEP